MEGNFKLKYENGLEVSFAPGTLIAYPTRSFDGNPVYSLSEWTGDPNGAPIRSRAEFETEEELELYAESLGLTFFDLGFEPDYMMAYVENRIVPLSNYRNVETK